MPTKGSSSEWGHVNTRASYYSGRGISFLGIPADDAKHYPMHVHFREAINFIHNIVEREKGEEG